MITFHLYHNICNQAHRRMSEYVLDILSDWIQLDTSKFKLLVVYVQCMSCVASLNCLFFFQTHNHSELLAYDGPQHENDNYTF